MGPSEPATAQVLAEACVHSPHAAPRSRRLRRGRRPRRTVRRRRAGVRRDPELAEQLRAHGRPLRARRTAASQTALDQRREPARDDRAELRARARARRAADGRVAVERRRRRAARTTTPARGTGRRSSSSSRTATGQELAATVWAPSDASDSGELGLTAPLPGVVYSGGVISAQPMYYWFAQGMAEAGYVVMTYDVTGQGRSEGTSTGDAPADLRGRARLLRLDAVGAATRGATRTRSTSTRCTGCSTAAGSARPATRWARARCRPSADHGGARQGDLRPVGPARRTTRTASRSRARAPTTSRSSSRRSRRRASTRTASSRASRRSARRAASTSRRS